MQNNTIIGQNRKPTFLETLKQERELINKRIGNLDKLIKSLENNKEICNDLNNYLSVSK